MHRIACYARSLIQMCELSLEIFEVSHPHVAKVCVYGLECLRWALDASSQNTCFFLLGQWFRTAYLLGRWSRGAKCPRCTLLIYRFASCCRVVLLAILNQTCRFHVTPLMSSSFARPIPSYLGFSVAVAGLLLTASRIFMPWLHQSNLSQTIDAKCSESVHQNSMSCNLANAGVWTVTSVFWKAHYASSSGLCSVG